MRILEKFQSQFHKVADRLTLPRRRKKDMEIFKINAAMGNFDVMKRIADAYPEAVHWRDNSGGTLLHHAATWRHAGMAAYYIAKGADIEAQDGRGNRPLHNAAQCAGDDPTACVDLLLARGAKMEVRNAHGETPLLFAVKRNKPWNVRALVLAGANPLAADLEGETPLSLAEKHLSGDVFSAIKTAQEDRFNRQQSEEAAKRDAETRARSDAAGEALSRGTKRAIKPLQRVTFKQS